MDKKLFDYITDHQKIWCEIREKEKIKNRIDKSRFYKSKPSQLLLKLPNNK